MARKNKKRGTTIQRVVILDHGLTLPILVSSISLFFWSEKNNPLEKKKIQLGFSSENTIHTIFPAQYSNDNMQG